MLAKGWTVAAPDRPLRVSVIGGGVAGLTAAVELHERGACVEVLERGPTIGAESCSRWAGGMLAPWCEREAAEPLVAELGEEGLAWWRDRFPGTVSAGSLVVATRRDEPELDRFARRTSHFERLDGDGAAALEPDLDGRFSRALFFPGEAHLDPRAALPRARRPARLARRADPLRRRGAGLRSRRRPGDRLPRPGGARRAPGPARREGRDADPALPGAAAVAPGAAAAPAVPALRRAARRRRVHGRRHIDRERRPHSRSPPARWSSC